MTREPAARQASILSALQLDAVLDGGALDHLAYATGAPLETTNPATGEVIGRLRESTMADYDRVVEQAADAFHSFRQQPAPVRGELVRRLGEELRKHKEPLGELISLEMGKIRSEGLGEVQEMIDICDFAVGLSRQLYGLTIASERPQHRMMEQWHPLGPIGVVTAFNFPMAVWSWNAALALVCGNPLLWKPSPHTPLCAIAVHRICERVSEEADATGVCQLVLGGASIGEAMAEDPRLPLISFTGSTEVGRTVAQTVAGRLGKSLLELGGNNAAVVMDDADLDLAVRAITFGAVGTAGQRCTSTRRVFVHRTLREALVERLVAAYRSVNIGNPLEDGVLMGPLISAGAVERYTEALRQATEEGGKVVTGGNPIAGPGHFVEPTIVVAPPQSELPIALEETFAPILYLFEVESLDEAIDEHNATAYGLSSSIFTDSVRVAEKFLSAVGSDCGIANVNIGTSGAEIGGAFGGEKDTGGGRESGSDAWKAYMRRQTNTINWGMELPLAQGVEF
ncbi:MAG: aldehyde dehydrogenase family protein [Myxococcota bacterium]